MSYRKLHFKNETWLYVIGKRGVKIRSPQNVVKNEVIWVEAWKILGYENKEKYIHRIYQVEGDTDGRYTPPISPQHVKDYIEKTFKINVEPVPKLKESLVYGDFFHASGECICEKCGKTYYEHPLAKDIIGCNDEPYLNRLCDGSLVKL